MKRSLIILLGVLASVPTLAQETEEPKEVKAIRDKMPAIRKALVKIRGLPFKSEVKVKYQTEKGFRAYLEKSLKDEIPAEKMVAISRLYQRLGLVPKGYDLEKAYINLFGSQAAAYYNPANDTFYILKTDMPANEIDTTALHELQHAIQDQYFQIDKLYANIKDNDDMATAAKFLVEGEATYVMTIYAIEKMGMAANMVDMQINMTANMDRERLVAMQKMALGMQGGSDAQKKSLAILEKTPRYLYRTLVDPYYKGAKMVMAVKKKGGWKAIEKLFKNPPTSSEQVLHPEKLIGKRDEPTAISFADLSASFGEGWSKKEENTLGEMGFQTIFKDLTGDKNELACGGWDGDRLHSYEVKGGKKSALVWYTNWDSEKDAKEFAKAYKFLLFKKYEVAAEKPEGGVLSFQKDGEEQLMALRGKDVLIIEGAPAGKAKGIMAAVMKSVKLGSYEKAKKDAAPKKEAKKRRSF